MTSNLIIQNRNRLFGFLVFSIIALGFTGEAQAQTAIDELKTEADKVTTITDAVLPVAVSTTVFSVGAVMLKRIAFS